MAKKCSVTYPCAPPTLRVNSSIRLEEGLWYGILLHNEILLHNVLILLLVSLCSSISLQAQIFTDDFEDGRLDQGALWYGDTSLVKHSLVDGISLLQSNARERGSIRLWSPLQLESLHEPEKIYSWEGYFRIRGAAPSRQNRLDLLFSMTSTLDPSESPPIDSLFYGDAWNGYGLRIEETGDDSLRFVRWDEVKATIVGTYDLLIEAGTGYHYRMEWDADSLWSLVIEEGYPNSLNYLAHDGEHFIDNTHPVIGYAGVIISCTSTRLDDFFLDFKLDPNIPPPPPFYLKSHQFMDSKRIRLVFSDDINSDQLDALVFILQSFQTGFSQNLTGQTQPQLTQRAASWTLSGPNALVVEWPNELNYLRYTLTIPMIFSADGRALDSPLLHFIALTKPPEPDSVFISEFLANPSSESNWPEYIEVYNRSRSAIDLSSSFLGDASRVQRLDSTFQSSDSLFFGPVIIDPESYMVFSTDPDPLNEWNPDGSILFIDLPYLNNTSDIIRLTWGPEGDSTEALPIILDELEYSSDWLADGISIERRAWDKPSNDQRNWGPTKGALADDIRPRVALTTSWSASQVQLPTISGSIIGYGTPGLPNTVERDTIAPLLTDFSFVTQNQLMLQFDETVVEKSLSIRLARDSLFVRPAQAQLSGSDRHNQLFYLQLLEPLIAEERVYIHVESASDWFGNTQTQPIRWVQYLPKDSLLEGEVVINELLIQPNEQWPYEYVELYNNSSKYVHLDGWTLRDRTSSTWSFPEGLVLYPNDFLVLTSDKYPIPSLNNDSDELVLSNADGTLIDSLNYDREWFHVDLRFAQNWGTGRSLERKYPSKPTNDPTNWHFHRSADQGSPSKPNPLVHAHTPTNLLAAKIHSSNSWTLQKVAQENLYIHVQLSEFIPNQKTWSLFIELDGRQIDLVLDTLSSLVDRPHLFPHHNFVWKLAGQESHTLEQLRQAGNWTLFINDLIILDEDGQNQTIPSLSIPLAFPLKAGSLGFHEIMFDPLADLDDFEPNGVEYIELWNQDKVALSLGRLTLGSAVLEDGQRSITSFFSTRFKWVEPDQAVLLVANPSLVSLQEHPIQNRHQIPLSDEQSVLMSQGMQFGLKKESDQRFLLMDSLVIDSIFYHQEWHNPNLYDTKGIALERIDTNPSQRSSRNWSSSVDPSGGTPLTLNSIEQLKQPAASPTPTVYFEPNPFSPDFDGYEDVTYLHYQYTSPDYLIRIWIFDRYGRQIIQLSQGHAAGTRGALMWDGLNENGQKVPIGRYIAYIEASDAAGRSVQRHKTTVVVAR